MRILASVATFGAVTLTAAYGFAENAKPAAAALPPLPAQAAPSNAAPAATAPSSAATPQAVAQASAPAPVQAGVQSAPQGSTVGSTQTSPQATPAQGTPPSHSLTTETHAVEVPSNETHVAKPPPVLAIPTVRFTTWDLNIEGAMGRAFTDPAQWTGFGRIRTGILHVRDSVFLSLGPTYEYSDLSEATFGLQGELMHLETGAWFQLGGLLDYHAQVGGMASAGFSILGVEYQYRGYEGIGGVSSVYAKLRIPLRVILLAISDRDRLKVR